MQGFMVHLSSETNGSLTIPATDRTHTAQDWYKADPINKITLTAHDSKGNTAQDCIVQLKQDATNGFDTRYDSRFLKGYAPQFYALAGDEYLSTNTLPEFNEFLIIDMGFVKNSSGEFTIEAEGLNSMLPRQNVYLKDMKLNYTQDLNKNALYHFTALEGDNPLRFKLLFAEEEHAWSADNIRVFQAYGKLEVHFGKPMDANVQVYNITGQLVLSKAVHQQSSCSLNMQTATGTYVVVVRTPEIIESKKVILF